MVGRKFVEVAQFVDAQPFQVYFSTMTVDVNQTYCVGIFLVAAHMQCAPGVAYHASWIVAFEFMLVIGVSDGLGAVDMP